VSATRIQARLKRHFKNPSKSGSGSLS
jgi:hypothetical protein